MLGLGLQASCFFDTFLQLEVWLGKYTPNNNPYVQKQKFQLVKGAIERVIILSEEKVLVTSAFVLVADFKEDEA